MQRPQNNSLPTQRQGGHSSDKQANLVLSRSPKGVGRVPFLLPLLIQPLTTPLTPAHSPNCVFVGTDIKLTAFSVQSASMSFL